MSLGTYHVIIHISVSYPPLKFLIHMVWIGTQIWICVEKFPADFDVHIQLKAIYLKSWCTRIGFLQVRITGTKDRKREGNTCLCYFCIVIYEEIISILVSFFCFLTIPKLESEKYIFRSVEHRTYFVSSNWYKFWVFKSFPFILNEGLIIGFQSLETSMASMCLSSLS